MIEPLEPRQLLNGGHLDATFGNGGRVDVDFSHWIAAGDYATFRQSHEDRSGYLYVTGTAIHREGDSYFGGQILVARVNQGGELDHRFGVNGTLALPEIADDSTQSAMDDFGRLYIRDDTRVYRLTSTGRFDKSFGNGGKATIPQLTLIVNFNVDGAGNVYGFGADARVVRLNSRGRLDTSWATAGVFEAPSLAPGKTTGNDHEAKLGRFLPDGKLVVALEELWNSFFSDPDSEPVIWRAEESIRLNRDGSIDRTYGNNGIAVESTVDTSDLHYVQNFNSLQADGSMLFNQATATQDDYSDEQWILRRISPDGKSIVTVSPLPAEIRGAGAIEVLPYIVQADGKYISTWQSKVFRTSDSGVLDLTWGNTGITALENLGGPQIADDGSIHVFGRNGGAASIARLWRDDTPVAQLWARDINQRTSKGQTIAVDWRDDDAIDTASLGSGDIYVERPDGSRFNARLVLVVQVRTGVVRGIYKLAGSGGTWDAADNGTYTVHTRSRAVSDINAVGNGAAEIGSFRVVIST